MKLVTVGTLNTPGQRGTSKQGEYPARYFLQGEDFFNGPDQCCFAWHTVNNAAGFILAEGSGARLTHVQQTISTILAHAGQIDANGISSNDGSGGVEEDIDRWAVTIDGRGRQ